MNELNPTNALGEILLDMIEIQYQGDFDSGIMAVMQVTGYPEETVVGIINGDFIVEDYNVLEALTQAFPDMTDSDMEILVATASGVEESDRSEMMVASQQMTQMPEGAYQDQYAGADVGGYGAEAGGESAEGSFIRQEAHAKFSALSNELSQVKNQLAHFQQQEAVAGLANRLETLNQEATVLVENGLLPPAIKRMLVGDFTSPEQRLATFSRMSRENGQDPATMLFATEYSLGLLAQAGKVVDFQDYSVTNEDLALANFSANLDHLAYEDYDAVFNR